MNGIKKQKSSGISLQYFLSLQFIFSATLPLIIVAALVYSFVLPQISKQHHDSQKALTVSVSNQITHLLDNASTSVEFLASLLPDYESESADVQLLLKNFTATNDFFEAIYLTDQNGIVQFASLPTERYFLKDNFIGLDMSRLPFYTAARKDATLRWSDVFLSSVSGRLAVAYTLPVTTGMLVGEVNVESLPELVSRLARQHSLIIMILDQKGHLIAHPDGRYSGQQLNLSNLTIFESAKHDIVSESFLFQQQYLFGTAIKLRKPEWVVIAAEYQATIDQQNRAIIVILIVSAIIALAASMIFGNTIAKVFSNKFKHYTKNAKQLAEGDYDLTYNLSKIEEFCALSEHQKNTAMAIQTREEAIKRREQRYKQLLEQSPIGIIEWDTDFNVLQWNSGAAVLFGYTLEEVQHLQSHNEINELLNTLKADLNSNNEHQYFESIINTRFGGAIRCHIIHTVVSTEKDHPLSYLTMVQDITEHRKNEQQLKELNEQLESRVTKRTEELEQANQELQSAFRSLSQAQAELVKSEKMAGLGSLVAGIAHELNTPIGNSLMAATTLVEHTNSINQSLAEETLSEDQLNDYLAENKDGYEIIIRNLGKASDLISSFKQVAVDQTSSKRRAFNLDRLVNEVITTLNPSLKKYAVNFITDIPEDIMMDSYPGALGQILTNLINNAITHGFDNRENGEVTIKAAMYDARSVQLVVMDNGKGIPPSELDSIFNPFYTTKLGQGGSGLGLNIAYNLTENILRGKISVSSIEHDHTTFELKLPTHP